MKKLIPVLLLIAICTTATAQKKYRISPSHTLHGTAPFGTYTNFDIFQDNISSDTIILKWKLLSNDLLTGWDYSTCAYGTCYAFIPDTLCTMQPIAPYATGFIALNLDPLYIKGTGSATLYVYEISQPLNGDTIKFVINGEPATGINDHLMANPLKIYPNPATETVTVKIDPASVTSNTSIQIIDVLGQAVYSAPASINELNVIDVQALPTGMYVVRYDYGNGRYSAEKLQILN